MNKLVIYMARGAQIVLAGYLVSLALARIQAWPQLADAGASAISRIAFAAVPAIVLFVLIQKRRTRIPALLAAWAIIIALICFTEPFLSFFGV